MEFQFKNIKLPWPNFDKSTIPNNSIRVGKNPEINKRMAYVYLDPQVGHTRAFVNLNGVCVNVENFDTDLDMYVPSLI